MFKKMIKDNRETSRDEINKVLNNCDYGVLATVGEDGYPYALPLSYVYINGVIYFHSAKIGHKLDNIKNNSKVSFNVVTDTDVIEDKFTTSFNSVVIFGEAELVFTEEKDMALLEIIKKYSKGYVTEGKAYIEKAKDHCSVVKINIKHITGKSKIFR